MSSPSKTIISILSIKFSKFYNHLELNLVIPIRRQNHSYFYSSNMRHFFSFFTSVIMSKLFEKTDIPIPEKMQLLQINHIKELRDNGFTDHPYLWAGFIASGTIH